MDMGATRKLEQWSKQEGTVAWTGGKSGSGEKWANVLHHPFLAHFPAL